MFWLRNSCTVYELTQNRRFWPVMDLPTYIGSWHLRLLLWYLVGSVTIPLWQAIGLWDNWILSTGLIMWIGHRKEIRKLMFRALALRRSENVGLWPWQRHDFTLPLLRHDLHYFVIPLNEARFSDHIQTKNGICSTVVPSIQTVQIEKPCYLLDLICHEVSSPSGFFSGEWIFFMATILQLKVAKRRLFEKVSLERWKWYLYSESLYKMQFSNRLWTENGPYHPYKTCGSIDKMCHPFDSSKAWLIHVYYIYSKSPSWNTIFQPYTYNRDLNGFGWMYGSPRRVALNEV